MPLVYEKNVPVRFCPAIADITAPTTGEIAAGVALQSYIPKDGVQFPSNRNMVDTAAIDDYVDTESPGTVGGTLVITFKRKNKAGLFVAWTTFKGSEPDDPTSGFFVFGFEGSNDQENDEVDVYQGECHVPVRNNPAANTEQRFVVNVGVQAFKLGATVVAGGS